MSGLQGLIFIAGLVVLGGVYAHWRWTQSRKTDREDDAHRHEPAREEDGSWENDADEVESAEIPEMWADRAELDEPEEAVASEPDREPAPQVEAAAGRSALAAPVLEPAPRSPARRETRHAGRVLVFYVMARDPAGFSGTDLDRAFRELRLVPGERDIFYCLSEQDARTVYCVANAVEPGNFDLSALDQLRTPGLTVFAVLPGPWTARDILAAMHRAALSLADRLGGEVLDARRAPLTAMSFQSLLDELPAET
jgi:cell division protein ZipA